MRLNEAITIRGGGSGRTQSFMDDFYDATDEHPFNSRARIYKGVVIELTPFGNTIHIADIVSTQQGSGIGAKAIQFLISLANKHRVTLDVLAKAYTNPSDTERLVRWYMKMGFRITDDLVDDPSDLDGVEAVEMKYFPR